MKDYTEKTGADQGLVNPSIPPFLINEEVERNEGDHKKPGCLARDSALLDDRDTTGTIGGNAGGWNVKVKKYPGTGEEKRIYYMPGYSGVQSERDWDTTRDESLSPNERAIRDDRNLRRSLRRTRGMIYDLARANKWELFCNFTFNKDYVDRYDYDECLKKLQNQLKKMKRHYPDMKHVTVAEEHEDGAYHFHGLFKGVPDSALTDSGKKDEEGRTKYNVDKYTVGFTEATRVSDSAKAANYMAKYITKGLLTTTKGRQRYLRSEGLQEPIEYTYLMSDSEMVADYFEHVEDVQWVNDVRVENGEYQARIIYAECRKLNDEEKEERKQQEIARVKARRRRERAEILRSIERRAP